MPARSRPISNVVAGAFLLMGIVLAIVISFVLSTAAERFKDRTKYTVVFTVFDGATGIKEGSDVLLGGQNVGKVSGIRFEPATGVVTGISVDIRIKSELALYNDGLIHLERPLLGALSTINIASLGNTTPGAVRLNKGDSIKARLLPPSLLAQAGFGSEQVTQVQRILSVAEDTIEKLSEVVGAVSPKMDKWTASVDEALTNVASASSKAGPLLDDAQAGLSDLRKAVAEVQVILDDGRPRVKQILIEAEEAAAKINGDSIARLQAALDEAQKAVKAFTDLTTESAALLREETPSVHKMLANARLASDQLKLAAVEVRSQPWRILYRPTTKETETAMLYDTARAYATAVSDLRATSESLAATLRAVESGDTPVDRADLQAQAAHLKEAFEKYKLAEQELLDLLIRQTGAPAAPPPQASQERPGAANAP